jgi:hypothetical protein
MLLLGAVIKSISEESDTIIKKISKCLKVSIN